MATIVVLAHEHERFHRRHYLIQGLFPYWIEAGHQVVVHEGLRDIPGGDLAVLHVDRSVIEPAYAEALARFPRVINGRAVDVTKRAVSRHLIGPTSDWPGAVIVKTDLNCGGLPERYHAQAAAEKGIRLPSTPYMKDRYRVYPSIREVPDPVWQTPALVVEKFLPERTEEGYFVRHWIFFGDRERCNRVRGDVPVLKAEDVKERVPVPVPAALRAERARLGFDYGKLDFAIHEGEVVLFDVNRTPTIPGKIGDAVKAGMAALAPGIEAFLDRPNQPH